MTKTVGYIRED